MVVSLIAPDVSVYVLGHSSEVCPDRVGLPSKLSKAHQHSVPQNAKLP
jgi:hypothetical protein